MFNDIIGNDKIKNELKQTIELNKISHSYLFIGTDGIGKKIFAVIVISIPVTIAFYFILGFFGTSNLIISTISVTTSFIASTLTMLRSPWYAVAYALNDVVLIALWILASVSDISFLPMVFCFLMFLINDLYGFYNWIKMEKEQSKKHSEA